MTSKDEEVDSLEASNTMLRRQLISSINNEESSKKEILEVRSKNGSAIFNNSRSRAPTSRYTVHTSIMNLAKKGRAA